ncbi:prolyl oligopeptidase family serine peptidase [Pedobacter sp.]|jgi:prolyl oligopeptidase|uniref:prolyl oligopeptidase family serine peptidase n=1 Tax=Pedobacter sp. TaxID=1411316 RepID=UPI002CFE3833|nr:prolyl oligopeptidase family serine peptidase [Pedobacter sp.]HWW38527.1 prolyl oligopeptidase family serine peptidase [Pedobacter sp.]
MKRLQNSTLLLSVLFPIFATAQQKPLKSLMKYPETKIDNVKETYFGTVVDDPYRWLEDDRSAETKAWVTAQNEVTRNYLAQIPFKNDIKQRLTRLMNYEKYSQPFNKGAYTYFYKNSGLQNQSVLYRQKEGEEAEVFLDPNTFSKDATTSLAGISFSKDGSLLAYQLSEGGSDWTKVVVMKASDKTIVGDTLVDVKFSGIAWQGNNGFYYSSYDKPAEGSQLSGLTQYHKLYFHQLGTAQKQDQLIFGGDKTPRRYIGADLTEDERYLIISAANSTSGNELYIRDLSIPNSPIVSVVDNFEQNHSIIDNIGTKLYIYTNLSAPNGKIITVDASNPKPEHWKTLINETENVLNPSTGGGKIFANYIKDAVSLVLQYDTDGRLEHEIELPGIGTATGFGSKKEEKELFYMFTSYVYPTTIFKYSVLTGKSEIYKKPGVDFDPSKYESKQVFFASKDGTRVPMIITYKKGLVLNGKNPVLLYGYGGFNISLTPAFSTSVVVLLEQGAVYAVPNLRGGGEYGEKWHLAGTKMQKQNVFDDFIAAAEYLIKSKYTSSDKLAIMGGSNGGLLVGATMAQRPELFKVALPAVGVMDMLRYHKFTAGAGWSFDYGTSEDSKEMFEYLHHYSPVHALKRGVKYPATLVSTADHDDRVVPAHSFKFAAALQKNQGGNAPVLISIQTNAGHGAGKPTDKAIEETADKWAFLLYNMGLGYQK